MKAETREMLDKVDKAHDWIKGPVRAGIGTEITATDTCQACSMRRHYSHEAGSEATYRFSLKSGTDGDLSLRQALLRGCSA